MELKEIGITITIPCYELLKLYKDKIPASMELNENEEYYVRSSSTDQHSVEIHIVKRKTEFYF